MRLIFREKTTRVEMLLGLRSIRGAEREIDQLRQECGQSGDVPSSIDRIVLWSAIHRQVPAALLLRRQGTLYAVVWLTFRRRFGIILGYVNSGDLSGQGSVIASPDARRQALEITARILLRRPLAHTTVLSVLWHGEVPEASATTVHGVSGAWQFHEVRYRLSLEGGFEAVMERLGYKMRRNVRYYRRRAEKDLGCNFVPDMSPQQRQQAVLALFDKGTYPLDLRRAEATEAALLNLPGHFAMGLRNADGTWLSYVAGWRGVDGTHIDWQLNHDTFASASLSTVMRGYLLEHEAGCGSPKVAFVGLTSDFWSRVCEAETRGDLVATRSGLVGAAARWLTNRMRPAGRVANLHARAMVAPDA